jgi:hypothetical protein
MSIKPCPFCKGRSVNNVMARLISGPCELCNGLGQLDTEKVCGCGRPATKLLAGREICTRFECGVKVLEAKKKEEELHVE